MAFLGLERPPWAWILLLSYAILLFHSLWKSSLPSIACSEHQSCLYPLINSGDTLSLELWLFSSSSNTTRPRWNQVDTCTLNITLPQTGILPRDLTSATEKCTVELPPESRIRWTDDSTSSAQKGGPLRAKFIFCQFDKDSSHQMGRRLVITEIPFELTRIVERTSLFSDSNTDASRRNLLNEPSRAGSQNANKASETNNKFVPYLKYDLQPILFRFVAETRPFGGPPFIRNDGIQVVPWNRTTYRPLIYIDENALERSKQQEIAPPEQAQEKPPVTLRIQISSLSPIRDVINQQVTLALNMAESILSGSELDEFRYFLRDERLYRFLLTQVISFIHVWVDYLAFRDEVRFYKNKTNFAGISVSSVLTRLVCSIIIFLYLLDGGGTSWVVLISVLSGVLVDAWKALKLLRPQVVASWPFIKFRVVFNSKEQATADYDRIAIKYLAMFLYPLVVGWSIYALKHYTYKSWYSWLISNLANAVYTFGFISMCPQLYVNYRLKSVAHLPCKVFLYKVFNTFVDDVFAFLIDMPWKHRVMTLRDDVVFGVFLVQAYVYRVDKTRANEFGYSYENEETEQKEEDVAVGKDKID